MFLGACVSVSEKNINKAISIIDYFDLAEIRLDLCKYDSHKIRKVFSSHNNLIATYRSNNSIDLRTKEDALKIALQAGANYLDIEYDIPSRHRDEMILYAQTLKKHIILSYHNYDYTNTEDELQKVVNFAKSISAKYTKIVTQPNGKEDVLRLMSLYADHQNIIAFGLGEKYKYTRMTSLALGAPFTYVYYGNKKNQTMEGQISHREYEMMMEIFNFERTKYLQGQTQYSP